MRRLRGATVRAIHEGVSPELKSACINAYRSPLLRCAIGEETGLTPCLLSTQPKIDCQAGVCPSIATEFSLWSQIALAQIAFRNPLNSSISRIVTVWLPANSGSTYLTVSQAAGVEGPTCWVAPVVRLLQCTGATSLPIGAVGHTSFPLSLSLPIPFPSPPFCRPVFFGAARGVWTLQSFCKVSRFAGTPGQKLRS